MRNKKSGDHAPGTKNTTTPKGASTQKPNTAELKRSFKKQPGKTIFTLIEAFCCPLS